MAYAGKYDLSNLPPRGNRDLGPFLAHLFEQARSWKVELDLESRWNECHRMVRGRHWPRKNNSNPADRDKISLALGQANVMRTCSNLVGSFPKLQVKTRDGVDEGEDVQFRAEQIFSAKLLNWWDDTEQQSLLFDSTFQLETYNISFEKSVWHNGKPDCFLIDPYAAFPARGNWRRLSEQAPYFIQFLKLLRDEVERKFKIKKGELSGAGRGADTHSSDILGEFREENKPDSRGITTIKPMRVEGSNYSPEARTPQQAAAEYISVIDCWIRDYSMETMTISAADILAKTANPEDNQGKFEVKPLSMGGVMNVELVEHRAAGTLAIKFNACPFDGHAYADYGVEPVIVPLRADAAGVYRLPGEIRIKYVDGKDDGPALRLSRTRYPGGIRNVVATADGKKILSDRANPSINHKKPRWMTRETYLYSRFPVYCTNSKRDPMSLWGLGSDLELTAAINLHMDEMISRAVRFMKLVVWPFFIVPQGSNISEEDFSNIDFNILQPPAHYSDKIRFVPMQAREHLSAFFESLDALMTLFDRLWQIHDVARGEVPYAGMSGNSIASLQQQATVPLLPKVQAANYLVRERGRCAMSHFLNHHNSPESLEVQEEPVEFQGDRYLGRKLSMHVKSGSTVARTEDYLKEIAFELYDRHLIPKPKTLELLEIPGWQDIAEQLGEGELAAAMQVMMDAGLEDALTQGIVAIKPELAGLPALGEGATADDAARIMLQFLMLNQPSNKPRPGRGKGSRAPAQGSAQRGAPQTPPARQVAGGAA